MMTKGSGVTRLQSAYVMGACLPQLRLLPLLLTLLLPSTHTPIATNTPHTPTTNPTWGAAATSLSPKTGVEGEALKGCTATPTRKVPGGGARSRTSGVQRRSRRAQKMSEAAGVDVFWI